MLLCLSPPKTFAPQKQTDRIRTNKTNKTNNNKKKNNVRKRKGFFLRGACHANKRNESLAGKRGGSALSVVGESMNNCLHVINYSFILEACLLNFQNVYFIYLDPLTGGCWQTYDLQYATAVNQLKHNPGRVLLAARCGRKTNTIQARCTSENP